MKKTEKLMPPVHPGEVLREDFMKPLGLSVNRLALELHVPATRIGEIVHERRRITAETALRLARYFHTNAEFWLNLQNFYDLELSTRSGKASEIEHQVDPAPSNEHEGLIARDRGRRMVTTAGGERSIAITRRRRPATR